MVAGGLSPRPLPFACLGETGLGTQDDRFVHAKRQPEIPRHAKAPPGHAQDEFLGQPVEKDQLVGIGRFGEEINAPRGMKNSYPARVSTPAMASRRRS